MVGVDIDSKSWGRVWDAEDSSQGIAYGMDFTNHTYDNVIGKYYAQYRFYDPVNKRFMASDPIKDGDNWHVYCINNPETFVDYLGLMSIDET